MTDHAHHFDPNSGWCSCGYRDDGRLIDKAGRVYRPGRHYSSQELDNIRRRILGAPA